MRKSSFAVVLSFFLALQGLLSQVVNYTLSAQLGVQVGLNFNTGKNAFRQNFPSIKAFVGINSSNELKLFGKTTGLLNIGTSIGLYNKSLGNSLNLSFQDNQIDWTSNLGLGVGWGETVPVRLLQTINNVPFYNLQHQKEYAVNFSCNFIMNNYRRNQTNGAFSLTTGRFSMTYYNDGGPFFNLGFGDNFDRYWTGGLLLYLHDVETSSGSDTSSINASYNRVEFTFDQFTGYHPQMYELTGIFGADIQDYELYQSFGSDTSRLVYSIKPSGRDGYDFNASQYKISYNFGPNVGGSLGVIGSLRDYKREKYYALQDIIHVLMRNPIHPNKDTNRLSLGFNYNNRLWNQQY